MIEAKRISNVCGSATCDLTEEYAAELIRDLQRVIEEGRDHLHPWGVSLFDGRATIEIVVWPNRCQPQEDRT